MGDEIPHGWGELYPGACEELPPDMSTPKMKPVKITTIYDASHAPCLVTRRSVTGISLLLNNTVLRCTTKKQNTVETATYGAEMVAGRLAVEQVIDIRYKLRMLGVPIQKSISQSSLSVLFPPPISRRNTTPSPTIETEKQSRLVL